MTKPIETVEISALTGVLAQSNIPMPEVFQLMKRLVGAEQALTEMHVMVAQLAAIDKYDDLF